jgi:ADP-dependent NAD(P)H-hydrate dehydratase / NAD(P)H-hydrate epimerase
MKILNAAQIRAADQYTCRTEPISSVDLMERAASACARRITGLARPGQMFHVYCGMGNNGGDGLAIARMLLANNFHCQVFVVRFKEEFSNDAQLNFERLGKTKGALVTEIKTEKDLAGGETRDIVAIDALLGTGVSSQAKGLIASAIFFINKNYRQIISIDIPSGLLPDGPQQGDAVVRSSLTLTFHCPKLTFLLPENAPYVPAFEVLDIGLKEDPDMGGGNYHYVTGPDIRTLMRPRNKFSHKGTYGHALLLAGSQGKSGAALIAAEACLRAGAGLLTVHSTEETLRALAVRLPEAMSSEDEHSEMITGIDKPENYSAVGFGPGVGQGDDTALVLKKILHHGVEKLVIDADGLNILSENKTWLEFLPPATILTPHPKEFERLAGKQDDDLDRLSALRQFSARHNCIVVLKGAHTCVAMPDGNLFFNSSGNAGLAKGGTGDALTGIILGLLASGYNAPQSALIGVYVHGLAADLVAHEAGQESILAGDVVRSLPHAFRILS